MIWTRTSRRNTTSQGASVSFTPRGQSAGCVSTSVAISRPADSPSLHQCGSMETDWSSSSATTTRSRPHSTTSRRCYAPRPRSEPISLSRKAARSFRGPRLVWRSVWQTCSACRTKSSTAWPALRDQERPHPGSEGAGPQGGIALPSGSAPPSQSLCVAVSARCDGSELRIELSNGDRYRVDIAPAADRWCVSQTLLRRMEIREGGRRLYWPLLDAEVSAATIIGATEEDLARLADGED